MGQIIHGASHIITSPANIFECVCQPGKYDASNTCTPCAQNTYKIMAGNEACDACPSGYFQVTAKSGVRWIIVSVLFDLCCRKIRREWRMHRLSERAISRSCKTCTAGSVPSGDQTTCDNCLAGTYESGGSCTVCATGLYQDQAGQVSCKTCSFGVTNEQKTDCLCAAGRYGQSGVCTDCEAGLYQNEAGQ